MSDRRQVFIGTDCGATMSKFGGVWDDGTTISSQPLQRPTRSDEGPPAVVTGWIAGVDEYLTENHIAWGQVSSVGLAIPGPYLRYGVLGRSANLPSSFEGWDFYGAYGQALAQRA